MSREPSQADVGHSLMRPLKEIYLSLFVLFFRISRWKGRMKVSTASIGVSAVAAFLAFSVYMWISVMSQHQIVTNRWIVGGVGAAIFVVNDYFLSIRGHGIAFEKQFRHFGKSKRIVLYLAAIGIVAATGIAFYLSVADYHQAFNLPRK